MKDFGLSSTVDRGLASAFQSFEIQLYLKSELSTILDRLKESTQRITSLKDLLDEKTLERMRLQKALKAKDAKIEALDRQVAELSALVDSQRMKHQAEVNNLTS
ncbi:hypothetical protein ACOSQ2_028582 [Xanthoceras sorbifolium]